MLVIFLPVMGRSGMLLRPDIFIAALFGLLTGLTAAAPLALARAAADAGTPMTWIRSTSNLLLALTAGGLLLAISHEPYTTSRPKRLFIQQLERVFHEPGADGPVHRESHLWVNGMDILALQPLASYPHAPDFWQKAQPHACRRSSAAACSFPWLFPLADVLLHGWLLPAPPPPIPPHLALNVTISREALEGASRGDGSLRRVVVRVTGAPRRWNALGQRQALKPITLDSRP